MCAQKLRARPSVQKQNFLKKTKIRARAGGSPAAHRPAMASSALDEMFEEIEGLLEAQHSLSSRWYARHSGMPVDEARAMLEAYLKKRGKGKTSATFLLGGTPASGGGLVFKLASAAALAQVKAGFSTITTEQLYSLHAPAMPGSDALPLAAIATA
jgi:hypothetical protein